MYEWDNTSIVLRLQNPDCPLAIIDWKTITFSAIIQVFTYALIPVFIHSCLLHHAIVNKKGAIAPFIR